MKKVTVKKTKRAKKIIAQPKAILAFLRDLFAEEIDALNRKKIAISH
ncbi:MAG: hypothetical protein JSS90_06240 [Bacteroidetes bacterium]|jgi:hypothetical protein|nr:hypothetical protein [Bacteroidota bacterium]